MAKDYQRIFKGVFSAESDRTFPIGTKPQVTIESVVNDGALTLDMVLSRVSELAKLEKVRLETDGIKYETIGTWQNLIEVESLAKRCQDIASNPAEAHADLLPVMAYLLGFYASTADFSEPSTDAMMSNFHKDQRSRPLVELNAKKAEAKQRAKSIAREKWALDTDKKIKITKMADQVYRALADEGYLSELPGNSDPLKDWIASVAPDYARKGGRPRKTP